DIRRDHGGRIDARQWGDAIRHLAAPAVSERGRPRRRSAGGPQCALSRRPTGARAPRRLDGALRRLLDRSSGCARTAPPHGGRTQIPHPERRRPMTDLATLDAYGMLVEPATLKI